MKGDDGGPPVPNDIDCFRIVIRPFMGLDEENFVRPAGVLTELYRVHSVGDMSDDIRKNWPCSDVITVIVKRERLDRESAIKQHS